MARKTFINKIFQQHLAINRYLLFAGVWILLVYIFPNRKHFKYEFRKGQTWQYENFYAPFDFGIRKSAAEIETEKEEKIKQRALYFKFSDSITRESLKKAAAYKEKLLSEYPYVKDVFEPGWERIIRMYQSGYTAEALSPHQGKLFLVQGRDMYEISGKKITGTDGLKQALEELFGSLHIPKDSLDKEIREAQALWQPNVLPDEELTREMLRHELARILPTRGLVKKGQLIISQGSVVDDEKYKILQSVKKEYEKRTGTSSSVWLSLAYAALIGLSLLMLYFFIKQYRPELFRQLSGLAFVLFNMIFMAVLTTLILRYKPSYLYIIPYALLPLVIKAFFDSRLGLFVHVLTILTLGFIVPNGFEFIFIQIIAGIVTILSVSGMNRRSSLFFSVLKITLVYLFSYMAFSVLTEGNWKGIHWEIPILFILNGLITVSLVIPLIFSYEKIFGLVSDESLRELSDTNSKLLRELNEKAPGTFQHSIQVANLAEAAAKEIGANALLIRAGALYHDIGKILNPVYFTENQMTHVNPHDELTPYDSASIIIEHVIAGVELAQKYKLPDRVTDFIRTHHGTGLVYYFYKKALDESPGETVNPAHFRYPGPIPYSRETAILMMCDAAEAATKSLKEPTASAISELIDKIVQGQMDDGQYNNAEITFKEIETVKAVIKKKLNSIYHVRIAYPE